MLRLLKSAPRTSGIILPHAILMREVFSLSNGMPDVRSAVVIRALRVFVTGVDVTGVCSAKIVIEAPRFFIAAAAGVDARLGPLVPTCIC